MKTFPFTQKDITYYAMDMALDLKNRLNPKNRLSLNPVICEISSCHCDSGRDMRNLFVSL
jgi:hypothetical protein